MIDDPYYQVGLIESINDEDDTLIYEQRYRRDWRVVPWFFGLLAGLVALGWVWVSEESGWQVILFVGGCGLVLGIYFWGLMPAVGQFILNPSVRITITDAEIRREIVRGRSWSTRRWSIQPDDQLVLEPPIGAEDLSHPRWIRRRDLDEIHAHRVLAIRRGDERLRLLIGRDEEIEPIAIIIEEALSLTPEGAFIPGSPELVVDERGLDDLAHDADRPLQTQPPDVAGLRVTHDDSTHVTTVAYLARGWLHGDTIACALAALILPAAIFTIALIMGDSHPFSEPVDRVTWALIVAVPVLIALILLTITVDRATFHQTLVISPEAVERRTRLMPWPSRVRIQKSDVARVVHDTAAMRVRIVGTAPRSWRDRLAIMNRMGVRRSSQNLFTASSEEVAYYVWLLIRERWDDGPVYDRQ